MIRLLLMMICLSMSMLYGSSGSRDETRVCNANSVDEKTTTNSRFINCIWYGDGDKLVDRVIVDKDSNGKPLNPKHATYKFKDNIKSIASGYGFYTCKGKAREPKPIQDPQLSGAIPAAHYYFDYNCTKQSGYLDGGGGAPDPAPIKDIIVEEDSFFGNKQSNFIYTKVSGTELKVRMFRGTSAGLFGAGLSSAGCTVYYGSSEVYSGSATYSFWSGGGAFIFTYKLPKSGQYYLQCKGIGSDARSYTSPKLDFYTFPASYSMELQTYTYENSTTLSSGAKNINSDGRTTSIPLQNNKFPITKVGKEIRITLIGKALTKEGKVDVGVSSNMSGLNSKNTITGTCPVSAPIIAFGTPTFSSGQFGSIVASMTDRTGFNETYKGKASVDYRDSWLIAKIEQERKRGGCSGNGIENGKCPTPPTFQFNFDYQFVPNNFKVELKASNGSDIKVLYYGQGSSPSNEGLSKLNVTPLLADNSASKNFTGSCAAIDTTLELTSNDFAITLADPNSTTASTTTLIPKDTFVTQNNGALASMDKVLSINKKDTTWSPNMVNEPSFLSGIEALLYFTGKKNDNMYPQYTNPIIDSLKEAVILRGRINAIDSDNAENYNKIPTTKVYYEFYCRTCSLCEVGKITGVDNQNCTASNYKPSPTQQGWFIDETFSTYNSTLVKKDNITTQTGLSVNSAGSITNGMQEISYNNANTGKYQMKIEHGKDASQFPLFLLYNPYYSSSTTTWGTSSSVTIHNKAQENTEDFGLDTGDAKNTRGGGRTGGY